MAETNNNPPKTPAHAEDGAASSAVRETPQSGLTILRNIALYLLVPLGVLLLIKFMLE